MNNLETCWVCGNKIDGDTSKKLDMPIAELGLSTRSRNCLIRGGINYVEELLMLEPRDLLKLRNCGYVCLNEINEKIRLLGFHR